MSLLRLLYLLFYTLAFALASFAAGSCLSPCRFLYVWCMWAGVWVQIEYYRIASGIYSNSGASYYGGNNQSSVFHIKKNEYTYVCVCEKHANITNIRADSKLFRAPSQGQWKVFRRQNRSPLWGLCIRKYHFKVIILHYLKLESNESNDTQRPIVYRKQAAICLASYDHSSMFIVKPYDRKPLLSFQIKLSLPA